MSSRAKRTVVKADLKKNRLIITPTGTIRRPEMEGIYTEVRFCVDDLQPGFDVVTDLRNCKIGYLSGAVVFQNIVEYLIYREVGTTVRIAGKPRTILRQINRITKNIKGYSPHYVGSMEEAEIVLMPDNTREATG